MSEFEFTVIIPTYNSELGIKKSIDSLINQTLNFKEDIEIIIADGDSEDNTKKICEEYIEKYPDNIKYFSNNEVNLTKVMNISIQNSSGKFITFLEPHDYYSKNTFQALLAFIKENSEVDLISIPLVYFKNNKKWNYLNYKIKKSRKINLLNNPKFVQLLGLSTFFKRDSIENINLNNINYANISFFSEILINNPLLGIFSKGTYFSNNIDEKIYPSEDISFSSKDYNEFIEYNFDNLIENSLNKFSDIPQFIQFNLVHQLRWLLSIEKTDDELDLSKLVKNIKYIDDEIILNNDLLDYPHKIFSFLLKYNYDLNEDLKDKLDLNTVFIDNYDIINNTLRILASTRSITARNIDIFVNGKKVEKKELRFPQKDETILNTYIRDYSIESNIPLDGDDKFKIEFKQNNKQLHIDFSRPCNFSKIVGYAKTKHYLSILKDDAILIEKKNTIKWLKQELKSLAHIVKEHETGFEKAIPFRIAYMIGYPFLRNKRIWFYMDRPDESDDNGLALFKYAVNQDDGNIDKYFILSSKNKDFKNIQKIGKVIPYKSLKHRYLGMFVENIITSHPDNEIIYPFWGGYPFFAGLLKSNTIFLQHGVLKDNISSWLNKSNMNLSFFLTSAHMEYESILDFPYNYDEEVIQLLGLPRYDTLENKKDKKQIIIMPSWRRNLDHKSKEYVKRNEFFKKLNSLINNEKLIDKAKEYEYEIIFRPHPKVYEYIDLFDKNDYVKIDYDKVKYQTLFNNGSLMVTDYSSVAFDFAYLYKPVIYYQYGSDYHFDLEDSYFDYETMGFGEIVKTEDELVDLIVEYIENDCKIKEKYHRRISQFFLFDDKNNCKRVHDKIKEVPLKD